MGNTLETQSETKKSLTERHVKAALENDKGTNAHLVSWEIEDFTKKGEHFIGVVTGVNVKYTTGEEEHDQTYIVKLMPLQTMKALRDMVTQGSKKELMFYRDLLPTLNSELRDAGLEPLRTPDCVHMEFNPEKPILLLTDLRPRGFKKYSPNKCLDVAHTNLILKELARLHAASHLLKVKLGQEDFAAKVSFLDKEWYNITDDAITFFKSLYDENVQNGITILERLGGDERAIQWLKKVKPDVYEILEGQMKRDLTFATVCHADCVHTNTLFRYSDDGTPVEVMLLDFQIVRHASLVTDLHLLLNICLYGSDRKENIDNFFQTYYDSFKSVTDAKGLTMPFSLQELVQEYQNKHIFGTLWGMSVVPLFAAGGEIGEWSDNKEGNKGSDATPGEQKKIDLKLAGKDAELKTRFIPIFEDMVECGIIN